MRDLIKKVLRESEEETAEEFIARFEKDKKRIEKTIPKIVNFLKSGFDDYNLLDISVGEIPIYIEVLCQSNWKSLWFAICALLPSGVDADRKLITL